MPACSPNAFTLLLRSIRLAPRLALLVGTCVIAVTPRAAHAQELSAAWDEPPPTQIAAPAPMPAFAPAPAPVMKTRQAATATAYTWLSLQPTGSAGRVEIFDPSARREQPDADAEDRGWVTLCEEPCGLWVPAGAKLRVNGRFKTGVPFVLPHAAPLTVVASPGRRDVRGIGLTLGIGGTVVLGAALLVAAFTGSFGCGSEETFRSCQESEDNTRRDAFYVAGVATLPAVAGWVMFGLHNRTSIELRSGSSPSRPVFVPVALGHGLSVSPAGFHF
jgi:hypothetical protein